MNYALVTGASTGIGRAVAAELGKKGWNVGLVARRKERLEETKRMVEEAGGKAEVFVYDLAYVSQVNSLIKKVKRWKERIDILVNAADVWHLDGKQYFETELDKIPTEFICVSLDVGLKAAVLLARAFVPEMKGWGRVVNMSGAFAPDEKGCLPQYVTKKGVEMFTKQLALEYKDAGVTVNAVSPWYVWTEAVQKFFPGLKDQAQSPEDVARFIAFLCSDDAASETAKIWSLRKGQEPTGAVI